MSPAINNQQLNNNNNNNNIMQNERPIQVAAFSTFPVGQPQTFDVFLASFLKPNDLLVTISNPVVGPLDKQLDWNQTTNKCKVSFVAPIVGLYTITVDTQTSHKGVQFQAKAYDLAKVLINKSSAKCQVNESYEFAVDASEAGEGRLEIAVNEGEIPNQVQVLDNGKCIVNFVPEEPIPHVVDIKFNGNNVNGCPFVVHAQPPGDSIQPEASVPSREPTLVRDDKVIVNTSASFTFDNLDLRPDDKDVLIFDSENQPVGYRVHENASTGQYRYEFEPEVVGDYTIELRPGSNLSAKLPAKMLEQFPFSLKVFDYKKVIVSEVTDGVIGHPAYFFIDASQAGCGNLEIAVYVSSTKRNIANHTQSEANAKIRVCFTPIEAVDHTIDVKFNGFQVPNNPVLVRVAQMPQARLPVQSCDLLKYAAIDETLSFFVEYIGSRENKNISPHELSIKSCQVRVLRPDFVCEKLEHVELKHPDKTDKNDKNSKFRISFKPTKIGPYKLFISVNNELLPNSPIVCNVYNINEVKVFFDSDRQAGSLAKPTGRVNQPVSFTVDASRAGEGTLALAVVSGISRSPVQTDVKVSEKGHGLYNLTFVPTEFAVHSIDMSFNDKVVPNSPFVIDILDKDGRSSSEVQAQANRTDHRQRDNVNLLQRDDKIVSSMENLNLKSDNESKFKTPNAKSKSSAEAREDELLESIVVHGISLKRSPVNSTGAFIIETNRQAHARDFDVLITDSSNYLVNVQCYLQQDGNLLAEWTPERVGSHKIEVQYKGRQVPGSPFTTEAFDPSSVVIELPKSSSLATGDKVEVKVSKREAGKAELDAVIINAAGKEFPVSIDTVDEQEIVSVVPPSAGVYKLSITLGGYEVPKSPLTFTVRDKIEPVRVAGAGLRCAELNRNAQFSVDTSADGELKIRIENGNREIVPKVERRNQSYIIKYKPTELGFAAISLYWNGVHIENSPYTVPINDLTRIQLINDTTGAYTHQLVTEFRPKVAKQIQVDTTKCGPGELKAEAYCRANPGIKFSLPVSQHSAGKHSITFSCPPEQPSQIANGLSAKDFSLAATYLLRLYFNNLHVPETIVSVKLSPAKAISPTNNVAYDDRDSHKSRAVVSNGASSKETVECPIVALRGHGLADARCGEEAGFTIDGSGAGAGSPEVRLMGEHEDVDVNLERIGDRVYKATYVINSAGSYTLNVLWDGKQVAGCPIVVHVSGGCDPSKVICTADNIKGAVLGEEIKTFIDTRKADSGELTALCTGPAKLAICELLDRGDGTFILYIRPQESGKHTLEVKYGGQHIPKSPFAIKVSGKPDPTKVRVYGPGVEHGVLSLYQSRFVCDTRGAGAGQLTVRIRGPKGAFRMETQRESQRDRTILCKYDPTEPGDYRIEIKWSGRHVPGSPFSVMIFDTQEELNRFLLSQQSQAAANKMLHNQVPFQPTMVEYGQYSNIKQPPFRLQ